MPEPNPVSGTTNINRTDRRPASGMTTTAGESPANSYGGWLVPPPFFNPFSLHSWVTFLVLGPAFFNFADGCIRRSLFQTSTVSPTPTAPPTSSIEEGTTMTMSHKVDCLEDEILSTNCLHGGTCYAVIINSNRQSFCHCTEQWTGKRCEQVFIDPAILATMEQNMRTAHIAAGVSVFIIAIFVLLLVVYVYIRYRKRQTLLNWDVDGGKAGLPWRGPFDTRPTVTTCQYADNVWPSGHADGANTSTSASSSSIPRHHHHHAGPSSSKQALYNPSPCTTTTTTHPTTTTPSKHPATDGEAFISIDEEGGAREPYSKRTPTTRDDHHHGDPNCKQALVAAPTAPYVMEDGDANALTAKESSL